MIKAPFSTAQVNSINEFQEAGVVHPFTCGDDECRAKNSSAVLVADEGGLKCPCCPYTQDWVHDYMADGSWHPPDDWPR